MGMATYEARHEIITLWIHGIDSTWYLSIDILKWRRTHRQKLFQINQVHQPPCFPVPQIKTGNQLLILLLLDPRLINNNQSRDIVFLEPSNMTTLNNKGLWEN